MVIRIQGEIIMKQHRRIVVLGGSFNPPTIAHLKLLERATKEVGATLGIFVPSSDLYVKRKMKKLGMPNEVWSEELRVKMLQAMCDNSHALAKLVVDKCELQDDGKGHTYLTMTKLQAKYPGSQLYFILGYDNLRVIPKWRDSKKFLHEFNFAVVTRDDKDPLMMIRSHSVLRHYEDHFKVISEASELKGISSSRVREALRTQGEGLEALLHPKVIEIIKNNTFY